MSQIAHEFAIDLDRLKHPGLAVHADTLIDLAKLEQQGTELALEDDRHAMHRERLPPNALQRDVLALLAEGVVAGFFNQTVDDPAVAELARKRRAFDQPQRQLEELRRRLVEKAQVAAFIEQHDATGKQIEAGEPRRRLKPPLTAAGRQAGGGGGIGGHDAPGRRAISGARARAQSRTEPSSRRKDPIEASVRVISSLRRWTRSR